MIIVTTRMVSSIIMTIRMISRLYIYHNSQGTHCHRSASRRTTGSAALGFPRWNVSQVHIQVQPSTALEKLSERRQIKVLERPSVHGTSPWFQTNGFIVSYPVLLVLRKLTFPTRIWSVCSSHSTIALTPGAWFSFLPRSTLGLARRIVCQVPSK